MLRPRIKPEHAPYRTAAGHIRIGSVIHGIGAEIEDPSGWIWTLLGLLDGTRPTAEAVRELTGRHPATSPAEAARAVAELRAQGFLEDADAPPPAGLTARDQERYGRGMALHRWLDPHPRESSWDVQLLLRRAHVLLVGLGGTGGTAAQALAASGIGHLHCVDPDTVELSNLNRQVLYRESDLGRPKADAALAHLRALNSDIEVTAERRAVGSPDDLAALLDHGAHDLLVLCADRPDEIRRWANRTCLRLGLPWTTGGYRGPLATAGVFAPGRGACWECLKAGEEERSDLGLAPGDDPAAASPRMPWNPVTAVTAGLSGTLVAHAALALLTGVPRLEPGFRYGLNLASLDDPAVERFPRRPDCPACGTGRD